MNTQLRRISRFWLEGGYLTDPPAAPPISEPVRYLYGLEDGRVSRFRYPHDRQAWLMDAPDTREAIRSTHPLARKFAIAAGAWPDDGDGV